MLHISKKHIILLIIILVVLMSVYGKSDFSKNDFIWSYEFRNNDDYRGIFIQDIKDSNLIVNRYPLIYTSSSDTLNILSGLYINSFINSKDRFSGSGLSWRRKNEDTTIWDNDQGISLHILKSPEVFEYNISYEILLDLTRPLLLIGDKHFLIFQNKKNKRVTKIKINFNIKELSDVMPYDSNKLVIAYSYYINNEIHFIVGLINIEKLIGN